MRKLFFLPLIVMAVLFTNSCASAPKKREIPNRKITVEELKLNDGTAWVAIDGVVYDVTHNKSWCCGSHHGIKAGQDLSERIKKSPHGKRTLENLPIVGKLDDGKAPKVESKVESKPESKVESKPEPQPVPVAKEEVEEVKSEDRRGTPSGRPVEEVKDEEVKSEDRRDTPSGRPAEEVKEKKEVKKEEIKKETPKKEEKQKESNKEEPKG